MEDFYKTETMPADWQFDKTLCDCMIGLYENNMWTDVKFRCSNHDDHERINAHKIVLAARSPVFRAQFFGSFKESNDEIVLINTEAETFDLFLRFIYQDKVTLTENIAPLVLETADYYQVTNLVLYCADYLASCITFHNVCEILNLAQSYKVTSLCKACCIFIDKNAEEVMESEGFLKLTEDSLTYVLKGDTLFAGEVFIFKKAEEWAQKKIEESHLEHNGQNIRKVLGESFFHLRLPTMSCGALFECTHRKGYFSVEEYEDLVGVINRKPCSKVTSNSCVRRFPSEEFMICSDVQGVDDKIETCFQLSVVRDMKVTKIELAEIYAYLKFNTTLYTLNRHSQAGQDLPNGLDVVLSGKLVVTRYKNKHVVIADTNNENKNVGSESLPCDTEDEEPEALMYDQKLKFNLTCGTRHEIKLTVPFILDESRSPYTFKVDIKCEGTTSVQIKTAKSLTTSFTSDHGVVKVENLSGNLTGIRGITFENVSNRD